MEKYAVHPYSRNQNEIHTVTAQGCIGPIISDQEKPRLTPVPRFQTQFFFFTTNRQEIKDPALYFLTWITELLPLNCSGEIQGLGWSTPWAEDCSAKSPSQFLSVPASCPRLFIPIEYFHSPCFLSSLHSGQKAFLLCIARRLIKDCCQLLCSLPQWPTRSRNSNCCIKSCFAVDCTQG